MPAISQKVLIDTIRKTVTLDNKAVIATGNLLREGEGYKYLYGRQKGLVDSLWLQIDYHKNESEKYKNDIVPNLENLSKEQRLELGYVKENSKIKLQQEKGKKWTFGLVGVVLGVLISLVI